MVFVDKYDELIKTTLALSLALFLISVNYVWLILGSAKRITPMRHD